MKKTVPFAICLFLCAVVQLGKSQEISESEDNMNRQQQVVHNENNTIRISEVTNDLWLRRTTNMDVSYRETNTESYITSDDLKNSGDQKQSSVIDISNQGAQNSDARTVLPESLRTISMERYYIMLYENGSHAVLDDEPELTEKFKTESRKNESDSMILPRNFSDITGHLGVTDNYMNDTAINSTTEFDLQILTYEEGLYTSLQPLSELDSQYVDESTNSSFDKKLKCRNQTGCELKDETKRDLMNNTFNASFVEDPFNSVLPITLTIPYESSHQTTSFNETDISHTQNLLETLEIERHVTGTGIPELLSIHSSIYVPNNTTEQNNSSLNGNIQNVLEGTANIAGNFEQSVHLNTEITNDYSSASNRTEQSFTSTTEQVGNGSVLWHTSDENDTKMMRHETTHRTSEVTPVSHFASDIVPVSTFSDYTVTTLSNNDYKQNIHSLGTSSLASLNQSLIVGAITEMTQKQQNTEVPIEMEQLTTAKSNIEIFELSPPQLTSSIEGSTATAVENYMISLTNQQVNIANTSDNSSTSSTIHFIEAEHREDSSLMIMPQTISILGTRESSVGSVDENYVLSTVSETKTTEATELQTHSEVRTTIMLDVSTDGPSRSQFPHTPEISFHSNISESSKLELSSHGTTQMESFPITTVVYKAMDPSRNVVMAGETEATELPTSEPANVTILSHDKITIPLRLSEGPLTTENNKIITPQFISMSDQEPESKPIVVSSVPPTALNPTLLYNEETFQTISDEYDTRISTERSILSSGVATLLITTISPFVRNYSIKMQVTTETASVLQDQHHPTVDDRNIYEVTNYSTHSMPMTEMKTSSTKFPGSENTTVYMTQQKTLFFQREIGNLSEEEMNNVVTVVFNLLQAHQNEDLFVLYVARFNDWLVQTVKEEMEQEAKDSYSNVTTVFQKGKNMNNNFVEVIYVLPSPNLQGEDVIFTFFCQSIQTRAIIPFKNILHLLSSDVEELQIKLNLNLRYFARGLYPLSDGTHEWTTLQEVWRKYGTLLITVGLFTILIVTILASAIVYLRCKAKQSGHYTAETDKLQCNLQISLEVGDMTPASVILQNEIFEKDSAVNGNHVCIIDDDEGWLVPLGDVPVEDANAPEVQDTKL